MDDQTSTEPTRTEHLRNGARITLDELAVHLDALAVVMRQLGVAAETPDVPVELGDNVSEVLDRAAGELARLGADVAKVDLVVTERTPLRATLHGDEPWGARAHGADPDRKKWNKRLSTVLSLRQILFLAEAGGMPWRDEVPRVPYLDGIEGLPGLEDWVSPRAARRIATERAHAIYEQALQEHCTTCDATPDAYCRTKTNRLAETFHKPRIAAATKTIDEQTGGA